MRSLQDEIRQAHRDLFCPVCGRTFELKDIRVRSFLGNGAVELSVNCSRGHFPVIMLVPLTLKELAAAGPITKKELKIATQKIDKLEKSFQELQKNPPSKNDR
ncbi:MAG TPA: hypothetical protein VLE93_01340 [Candidatus Saccharimonadales bacterium]|nr:hypothetical protein [Candidatus Saccharimonadales bacterium]